MYKTIRAINIIRASTNKNHLVLNIGGDVLLKAEKDTADDPDDDDHPDDDEGGHEDKNQQAIVLLSATNIITNIMFLCLSQGISSTFYKRLEANIKQFL